MLNDGVKLFISLSLLVVSAYMIGGGYQDEGYCIFGFSCGESLGDWSLELENYTFREEGITHPDEDTFFESLQEVIDVSREEYSDVIDAMSSSDNFTDTYNFNAQIFISKYSVELDSLSPSGEYIQNIGEFISNGYRGDCDDYALVLYLIAYENGLDVRYVIGKNLVLGHAWIQIKVDGEWKDYDSTSDTICDSCISDVFYSISYFEE